ncbi:tigger transposable element-derived protein 4-like [Acyrthosiphon pisum]|uniref:Tigger transposable element-derived protein 4 n=1 Tax=Acyrthosiphon pisum TaxID=7029 RepID=A0A8R2BAI1_ACYPI|nr:tigger transposable element-derived protein 4-like [Acyrthosiphon pisum]|eukprot:XP_008189539.1 PREDICTED: tigger transposable element-derived protein 4-like [Acyrthosiphon pisum]
MSASNSKKHKSLTISEKKQLIEAVERGDKKTEVAKTFDIRLSTLSTILKDKNKIITASSSGGRKRNSKGEHPRLEECLVQWVRQCRGQNVPVSGLLLKEKAKSFAKELGIPFFSASDGWLTNFKKRNGIVFKKMCGESSSVDDNVCSEWHRKLSTLLKNYEPRNMFNTDETALFFKCLPDKTFTFKEEKCHGRKHSKDRLTILLAVNMNGSEKLTLLLIGKAAKPRCFKGIRSFPITYRSNKKAWMTTELFNEWLFSLNEDMKKQERKMLLFLDNCTVHNNPPPTFN